MNAVKAMLGNSVLFRKDGVTWLETVDATATLIDPRTYATQFRNILTANGTTENKFTTPRLISSTITVPDYSTGKPPGATALLPVIIAVGSTGGIMADGGKLDSRAIIVAFSHNLTAGNQKDEQSAGSATVKTTAGQLGIGVGPRHHQKERHRRQWRQGRGPG